ncbi:DUF1905 domain-containing protein [Solilutibacter tolerans]|uniref:DUF1905 domain-containing protein n=1 Tax=Solilutibacter tolerans TaxID=1604334 RepID=UPI0013F63DF5
MPKQTSFTTKVITPMGGDNAGIEVPTKNLEELGESRKPKVHVMLNGTYKYETTVASRGGKYLLTFSKAHRQASGLNPGDSVAVKLRLV